MTKQDGLQATKSQIIIHRSPLFFYLCTIQLKHKQYDKRTGTEIRL